MIRTVITPCDNMISIQLPGNYIGKKLEVLLYSFEEVKEETVYFTDVRNASRFKGLLTDSEADKYHQYLQKARQEWDRNI